MHVKEVTYLPAASLQHLSQAQFVPPTQVEQGVNLCEKQIQESDGDCTPLHNNIIVYCEEGHHLHVWLSFQLGVPLVLIKPTLGIIGFQRQQTGVNKETAVAILGETSQKLGSSKVDIE